MKTHTPPKRTKVKNGPSQVRDGSPDAAEESDLPVEEEIPERPADVRRALDQISARKRTTPSAERFDKGLLTAYGVVLVGLAGFLVALNRGVFGWAESSFGKAAERLALAGIIVILILTVQRLVEVYGLGRIASAASRYNLRRILRLATGILVALVVLTGLFVNWYTAVVSLGLISVILGFALQTPTTSLLGWVYIIVKAPYRVGDRIKIGDATGDVIEVDYLDTTLWEFGGDFLSTDHPTGRIIRFPNSKALSEMVYNYSWPLFPYIWNEITFHVAYESDLEFVAATMQSVAQEELGEKMLERVRKFRELLAQTPVNELEVREQPVVLFRVNNNTWLDATVRYLVHPKRAGQVKSRLIREMLLRLNAEPDRVLFPKGNAR